jgi:hypothetical protein
VRDNPIVLICLVVIPCTYALALVALVRLEYRQPRHAVKGRHMVVVTETHTTVIDPDHPWIIDPANGVMPAELDPPGAMQLDSSPVWHATPPALPRRWRP